MSEQLQQIADWNLHEPRGGGRLDPERCAAAVHDRLGSHQCTRKAVITECGHGWCKLHAPSAEVARRDARHAKWSAESKRRAVVYDRDRARAEAADTALRYFRQQATHDELEAAVNAYAAALDAVAALGRKD